MSKPTTKATAKYQAKIGLVSKSYKLKEEIATAFKDTCEQSGEKQATVLMRLMSDYIVQSGATVTAQPEMDGQLEIEVATTSNILNKSDCKSHKDCLWYVKYVLKKATQGKRFI